VSRICYRIRIPPEASEIRENLQGSTRAREVIKDGISDVLCFLLVGDPELERTHAASIRDEARPIFRGWIAAKLLEGKRTLFREKTAHYRLQRITHKQLHPILASQGDEELEQVVNVVHFAPNIVQGRFTPAPADESI
jgi:hypothetical protein